MNGQNFVKSGEIDLTHAHYNRHSPLVSSFYTLLASGHRINFSATYYLAYSASLSVDWIYHRGCIQVHWSSADASI
jgi:hypothetical protein